MVYIGYTSVTSITHCRHVVTYLLVVTYLFHDCNKLWVRSVAAKRIGVGKMLSKNCSEYELQWTSWWSCWQRLLLFILHAYRIFHLQFTFLSDDKNADYIKIWGLSTASHRTYEVAYVLFIGIKIGDLEWPWKAMAVILRYFAEFFLYRAPTLGKSWLRQWYHFVLWRVSFNIKETITYLTVSKSLC